MPCPRSSSTSGRCPLAMVELAMVELVGRSELAGERVDLASVKRCELARRSDLPGERVDLASVRFEVKHFAERLVQHELR